MFCKGTVGFLSEGLADLKQKLGVLLSRRFDLNFIQQYILGSW
jgi:hypothetical protein